MVSLTVHNALALVAALTVMLNSPSGNEIPDNTNATVINTADTRLNQLFFF